jgi:hypothetical protein
MATQIFVNLPVKDLNRSKEFYSALGFGIDAQYTDQTAAAVIVSDTIYVMLLTEEKFKGFTPKEICDARRYTEVLNCLSCESREQLDDMVRKAVAAGGTTYNEAKEYGFMYGHGFQNPDSHIWELVCMTPEAAESNTTAGNT